MKAILLAVKPNQLVKILNGEKTIEVRKSKLPLNVPVYLYCTKGKPYLVNFGDYEHPYKAGGIELGFDLKNIEGHGTEILNGKVVAKIWFDRVETIGYGEMVIPNGYEDFDGNWVDRSVSYGNQYFITNELIEQACLTYEELLDYGKGKTLYAHHISKVEIIEPKEIGEFNKCDGFMDCFKCKYYPLSNNMGVNCKYRPLTKAPKSWCYVEEFK
jgi:hypothetical protein